MCRKKVLRDLIIFRTIKVFDSLLMEFTRDDKFIWKVPFEVRPLIAIISLPVIPFCFTFISKPLGIVEVLTNPMEPSVLELSIQTLPCVLLIDPRPILSKLRLCHLLINPFIVEF